MVLDVIKIRRDVYRRTAEDTTILTRPVLWDFRYVVDLFWSRFCKVGMPSALGMSTSDCLLHWSKPRRYLPLLNHS